VAGALSLGDGGFFVVMDKGSWVDLKQRNVGCVFLVRSLFGTGLDQPIAHHSDCGTNPFCIHRRGVGDDWGDVGDLVAKDQDRDIVIGP
tara:strand:- start:14742 stop:15008 length:267 start_codon:yes stop_codon:yes gene_type:complete